MLALLDAITRETIVFASVGLLVGGIDDLLVDLIFVVRLLLYRGNGTRTLADLPSGGGGMIVVFVPAWDESRVIGGMLRAALARFDHADYRIYVGLYPNDRATIDAAAAVAERDDRVTLCGRTGMWEVGSCGIRRDVVGRMWGKSVDHSRSDDDWARWIGFPSSGRRRSPL